MYNIGDGKEYDVMITSTYINKYSFNITDKIITGIQKLTQRFVILFLTSLESKLRDKTMGTIFNTSMKKGNNISNHIVNVSLMQAMQTLENDSIDTPDDEKIKTINVVNFIKEKNNLKLDFSLESKAGETYTFILPVKI